MRRVCLRNGCSNRFEVDAYADRKPSYCPEHRSGTRWHSQPAARQVAYVDPLYRRNRPIVIAREPECHWRFRGVCTLKSTTADHLLSVAQGGGHELENLVGACGPCNHLRGSSLGGAVAKQRRAAQRRQK